MAVVDHLLRYEVRERENAEVTRATIDPYDDALVRPAKAFLNINHLVRPASDRIHLHEISHIITALMRTATQHRT